jgi:hypothetical protein
MLVLSQVNTRGQSGVKVTQRFQHRHRSEFGTSGEGGEWLGSDGTPKGHVISLEDLPVGLGSESRPTKGEFRFLCWGCLPVNDC